MIRFKAIPYPNPVNEKAARVVAAGVALFAAIALLTGWHWLVVLLAIGFWARVLGGPRFSPLARLASDVIAPRLGRPRPVPGPPKRFAQAIGAGMTTLGAVLLLVGAGGAVTAILGVMLLFATLEAAFGLCVGCIIFNRLIRVGIVPREICEECADISRRYA